MPYKVEKVKGGFKVKKLKDGTYMSGKPLTKEKAEKQMRAIGMNSKH